MKNPKSPWLLAAIVTVAVAIVEGATVLRMVPGTTLVDVGALLFTGFLAGLFLGFYLMPRRAKSDGDAGISHPQS
jgi:hypothetical protein